MQIDRHIAISSGWVAGPAFGVAMMAAPEYFHLSPFIAAICFWGGIGVFVFTGVLSLHDVEKQKKMLGPILTMACGSIIFCIGTAWYFWQIEIHPEFNSAYDQYKDRLGKPIRSAVSSTASPDDPGKGAIFAWMNNAYVFWLRNPGIMIALDKHDGKRIAITNDYDHDAETEKDLWNDKKISAQLCNKNIKHPPHGSLSYEMMHNCSEWGWIGDAIKECSIDGNLVYSQKFENGSIYGIFRVFPTADETKDAIVFIVFNDKSWEKQIVSVSAPRLMECDLIK